MTGRTSLLLILLTSVALGGWGETLRLKVTVAGKTRKVALFVPKGVKKGEVLPLLVALPNDRCKAQLEIQNWAHPAYKNRFAVLSVDTVTGTRKGWHYTEVLEMSRDMEAVTEALEIARKAAGERGLKLDFSATVITGHLGGAYAAAWLGVRRPDLFMGIALCSPVFHKQTLTFSKVDMDPDSNQRIFIVRGEFDSATVVEQTELAIKTFKKAGYLQVRSAIIEGSSDAALPVPTSDWYARLLKETSKGRSEARKIASELVKVRALVEKRRAGAYGKLQALVDREKRAGFSGGAVAYMATIQEQIDSQLERAEDLLADNRILEAHTVFRAIERNYSGLTVAKQARKRAARIKKSNEYKATEMLVKAKALREKGEDEKAMKLLEKIIAKFPKTTSAAQATDLLKS